MNISLFREFDQIFQQEEKVGAIYFIMGILQHLIKCFEGLFGAIPLVCAEIFSKN